MNKTCRTVAWVFALTTAAPALAVAEEVSLNFRLVTQIVERTEFEVDAIADHRLEVARSVGTAVFEDGRIAHKTFSYVGDNGTEAGTFSGYSTYTFENGDVLNLSFTGNWSADGLGGDYEVLSGTGGFEGATGNGRFDAEAANWRDAILYSGSFILDLSDV